MTTSQRDLICYHETRLLVAALITLVCPGTSMPHPPGPRMQQLPYYPKHQWVQIQQRKARPHSGQGRSQAFKSGGGDKFGGPPLSLPLSSLPFSPSLSPPSTSPLFLPPPPPVSIPLSSALPLFRTGGSGVSLPRENF
jgi:hypothetical protein